MRSGGGRLAAAALICAFALTLTACGGSGPSSTGTVAGLPVTHFASGFKANAPTPDLTVRNASGGDADKLAMSTVADVETFWTDALPADFGEAFEPLKSLLSYDSNGPNQKNGCGDTKKSINAFYCPEDDSVSWDRGELLPEMMDQYGPLSVVTVLAHEVGHAVQYRLGGKAGITRSTPTIVREQQADCFAGSYYRWVVEGKSKYFTVSTSDGLNAALSSLFLVRDYAGDSAAADDAHGTAFDRIYAFQLGFEQGAPRCAALTLDNIKPRLTERRFDAGDQNKGDLDVDEIAIGYLQESLDAAFAGANAAKPQIVDQGGTCPGGPSTPPASYCPSSNTVSVDLSALGTLGLPVERGNLGSQARGGHGDFAAFSEIASRYALGIQKGVGASLTNANAGLRTACLVGAWAAATPKLTDTKLRLSSGDLDEAISDLLRPDSLVSADVNGKRVDAGFNRLEAMRTGYLQGSSPCSQRYS
ncbi:MAG TPA: neutral zinc metallopeptidase [Amycolatopsis sp.]|nr:neutral zinc metallopeptidase [Amycolatopsis sp.]